MNRPLGILAVLALGLIAGCGPSRNNPYERDYIGTWFAQGYGEDASFSWRLDPSGDFGEDKGYVTPEADDGEWRIDRGQIIFRGADKSEQRFPAKVVGNTMTVEKDGKTIIFTRVSK